MKRARTTEDDNVLPQVEIKLSRPHVDIDVHATTNSLPGLKYDVCVKCGTNQYLLKDVSWLDQDECYSCMGSWCLNCHISYYDYPAMTGLRCSKAKKNGSECCAYLDDVFECTNASDHVKSYFMIGDLNYAHQRRAQIIVGSIETKEVFWSAQVIHTVDNVAHFISLFRNNRCSCFDFSLVKHLKATLQHEHVQSAATCKLGG